MKYFGEIKEKKKSRSIVKRMFTLELYITVFVRVCVFLCVCVCKSYFHIVLCGRTCDCLFICTFVKIIFAYCCVWSSK